jgi:hypothetical protein
MSSSPVESDSEADEIDEDDLRNQVEAARLLVQRLEKRINRKSSKEHTQGSNLTALRDRSHVRFSTSSIESNDITPVTSAADDTRDTHQDNNNKLHSAHGPSLAGAIEDKLVKSAFSKQKFLPQNDFKNLVTRQVIKLELQEVGIEQPRHGLVEYIAEHAPKTFAALAYCGLVSKADILPSSGFDDSYLPVARDGKCITSLSGLPWDHPALQWFRDWGEQGMRDFCEKQWLFLPKVFTSDSIMEDLHPDCRLPLLTYTSEGAGGSFSFLHKATIHSAHQTMIEVSSPESLRDMISNFLG